MSDKKKKDKKVPADDYNPQNDDGCRKGKTKHREKEDRTRGKGRSRNWAE